MRGHTFPGSTQCHIALRADLKRGKEGGSGGECAGREGEVCNHPTKLILTRKIKMMSATVPYGADNEEFTIVGVPHASLHAMQPH